MATITAELAWRVRKQGLLLPMNREYATATLASIAQEQRQLMARMDALDATLADLAAKELIEPKETPNGSQAG